MNKLQRIGLMGFTLLLAVVLVLPGIAPASAAMHERRYDVVLTGDLSGGKENAALIGMYINNVKVTFNKDIVLSDGFVLTGWTTHWSKFNYGKGFRELCITFTLNLDGEYPLYRLYVYNADASKAKKNGIITIDYIEDDAYLLNGDTGDLLWNGALSFTITMTPLK